MNPATQPTPLVSALQQIDPHDHLCSIYENQEEQFSVAIPFIHIGLDRGEKCIYIADDGTEDVVREAMHAEGIDVERAVASRALLFNNQRTDVSEAGGTIFLDEIGELPAETQIALLRVLQEREFERVGGSQPISIDVRVITASNRNLQDAIAAGTFRLDLFHRLNVFPIEVPTLRERKEDIPMLLDYFIKRYAEKAGKTIRSIDKKTVELFKSYSWPSNIRELQNVIERSMILCESEIFSIDQSWLSRASQPHRSSSTLAESLHEEKKSLRLHWLKAREESLAVPGRQPSWESLVHIGVQNQAAQNQEESIQAGLVSLPLTPVETVSLVD